MILILLISFFLIFVSGSDYRPEGASFQYQNSFTGPFGGTHIPFWELGGSSLVKEQYIQLTSNQLNDQKGFIWSHRVIRAREWEIIIKFSVGSSSRGGGAGTAFWYTKERLLSGPIMGGPDNFNGLGIIVDTYDNDARRDGPKIYGVYNDNSFSLDPEEDGKTNSLGSCSAQIRQITNNPENNWIKLLVRLRDKSLYVAYDLTENNDEGDWIKCFDAPVPIEDAANGYYLGLTAETTSGYTDNHYIRSLSAWSLKSKPSRDKDEPPKESPKESSKDSSNEPPKETEEEILSSQKRGVSEDPTIEILTKLTELERTDDLFTSSLDSRFKEMQSRLDSMEELRTSSLSSLTQKLVSIKKAVDSVDFQDLKGDVKDAVQKLLDVKIRIEQIETLIEGTNQKTANLQGLHNTRSNEFQDVMERSSGWGFFTYLLFFQVIACVGYVWWKNSSSNDKSKKYSFD